MIGPILTGLSRSVQVLQRDASVSEIVNLTAYAVADAHRLKTLLRLRQGWVAGDSNPEPAG